MKTFRSIVVLGIHRDMLWTTMRDHLPELSSRIPDIESVRETARTTSGGAVTNIVNEWTASYPIPTSIRSATGIGTLGWTDRNSWDDRTHICNWAIYPYVFADYIACEGRTLFEPAMAGKGTRVTMEGTLDFKRGFLGGFATAAEKPIAAFLETVVTTVIPKNLRVTLETAAAFSLNPG